ncbi:MAG: hypothetical protein AB1327_07760 [Bacillota bacterium]
MNILLVDNYDGSRTALAKSLRELNHNVVECSNAAAVLKASPPACSI